MSIPWFPTITGMMHATAIYKVVWCILICHSKNGVGIVSSKFSKQCIQNIVEMGVGVKIKISSVGCSSGTNNMAVNGVWVNSLL